MVSTLAGVVCASEKLIIIIINETEPHKERGGESTSERKIMLIANDGQKRRKPNSKLRIKKNGPLHIIISLSYSISIVCIYV